MARLKACKQCGIPFKEGKIGIWQNNGVITDARDPSRRGIIYETDNLNYVLKGIEYIIGAPVEQHSLAEAKRGVRAAHRLHD